MARIRSPNYPAISLPEAINRVRTIHTAEQHLAAPKEVIAKHLGYGGMNGASIKMISAIEKYGLLEETTGDRVKVSSLAMSILFPSNPQERIAAIREAGFKPALFTEIAAEWEGATPSEENLRTYLIRKNFAADALDRVIQSYRETVELVTRESGNYTPPPPTRAKAQGGSGAATMQAHPHTVSQKPAYQPPFTPPTGTAEPFRVTFTGNGIEIAGRITDAASADELVSAVNALKLLLKPANPIPQPAAGDLVGTKPHGPEKVQEPTGVSFMITQAQRAELRRLGYTDDAIDKMTPEMAHSSLGLIGRN